VEDIVLLDLFFRCLLFFVVSPAAAHSFEHWAKERCLLPASSYPYYRQGPIGSHWSTGQHAHRDKMVTTVTTPVVPVLPFAYINFDGR
jgi:hypothetical protein